MTKLKEIKKRCLDTGFIIQLQHAVKAARTALLSVKIRWEKGMHYKHIIILIFFSVKLMIFGLFAMNYIWSMFTVDAFNSGEIHFTDGDAVTCLGLPQFKSRHKPGENPWFGAKNATAIALLLASFREAAIASGTVPMLAFGSLLGWKRHCEFNEHEGDFDFHVFKDGWNLDVFKQTFASRMSESGFDGAKVTRHSPDHYKLNVPNSTTVLGVCHVDVYVIHREDELAITSIQPPQWCWWPWEWIHPVHYTKVCGVEIGIINGAVLYIEHLYGQNWQNLEEMNHGHRKNWEIINPDFAATNWQKCKPYRIENDTYSRTRLSKDCKIIKKA